VSLKRMIQRVVVTGGLALTAVIMSHPGQAMMAHANHMAKYSVSMPARAAQPLSHKMQLHVHCIVPACNQQSVVVPQPPLVVPQPPLEVPQPPLEVPQPPLVVQQPPLVVQQPSFGLGAVIPAPICSDSGQIILDVPVGGNAYAYGQNPYFYGVGPWNYGAGAWTFGGNFNSFPWGRFGGFGHFGGFGGFGGFGHFGGFGGFGHFGGGFGHFGHFGGFGGGFGHHW
jgi:hypothetical protein